MVMNSRQYWMEQRPKPALPVVKKPSLDEIVETLAAEVFRNLEMTGRGIDRGRGLDIKHKSVGSPGLSRYDAQLTPVKKDGLLKKIWGDPNDFRIPYVSDFLDSSYNPANFVTEKTQQAVRALKDLRFPSGPQVPMAGIPSVGGIPGTGIPRTNLNPTVGMGDLPNLAKDMFILATTEDFGDTKEGRKDSPVPVNRALAGLFSAGKYFNRGRKAAQGADEAVDVVKQVDTLKSQPASGVVRETGEAAEAMGWGKWLTQQPGEQANVPVGGLRLIMGHETTTYVPRRLARQNVLSDGGNITIGWVPSRGDLTPGEVRSSLRELENIVGSMVDEGFNIWASPASPRLARLYQGVGFRPASGKAGDLEGLHYLPGRQTPAARTTTPKIRRPATELGSHWAEQADVNGFTKAVIGDDPEKIQEFYNILDWKSTHKSGTDLHHLYREIMEFPTHGDPSRIRSINKELLNADPVKVRESLERKGILSRTPRVRKPETELGSYYGQMADESGFTKLVAGDDPEKVQRFYDALDWKAGIKPMQDFGTGINIHTMYKDILEFSIGSRATPQFNWARTLERYKPNQHGRYTPRDPETGLEEDVLWRRVNPDDNLDN